jgi:hypothetical protein
MTTQDKPTALTTKSYEVVRFVDVTLDESKFTETFMEEFRESFFPFFTIEDHREHLAILYARGEIDGWSDEFIEGYGPANEMGISFKDNGSKVQ